MSNTPKVSIVIPTYNYAHYLDETIQSALNQTFTDFDLHIVDNCSTDNTDEVVAKYLDDPRVSYHKNNRNLGLVGNWNKCLDYAQGVYIKFLNADDKFHPRMLEKFVAILDQYPKVAIVGSYDEMFGSRNYTRISPFKGLVSGQVVQEILLKPANRLRNPSLVMFRKTHADTIGRFNPRLYQFTDREYYYRLLTKGDCYVIPEVLCFTRVHPNTQTAQMKDKKFEFIIERYWFAKSVKEVSTFETKASRAVVDAYLQEATIRCAAMVYELLPKLYKKHNRKLFLSAYKVGVSEKVLFTPVLHYLRWKHVSRLFQKKKRSFISPPIIVRTHPPA